MSTSGLSPVTGTSVHELRVGGEQRTETTVATRRGGQVERRPPEQDGIAAAVVRIDRHDDGSVRRRRRGQQGGHGLDREARLVAEHDERGLDVVAERRDPDLE